MSIPGSVSRLAAYYRLHGLAGTISRAQLALKRSLFANRMVVLYCDLDVQRLRVVNIPKNFRVQRLTALAELSAEHLQQITSFWNPKLANRNILQRFKKGASLWLVTCEDQLAGYGWTLRGQTIAEYYFPLAPDDVQLFDFFVFPRFRGRALHWLLTGHILHTLAAEGGSRAFADTHEWNQAQLASFKMTPFRPLGFVRTYNTFGQLFTRWTAPQAVQQRQKGAVRREKAVEILRPNE